MEMAFSTEQGFADNCAVAHGGLLLTMAICWGTPESSYLKDNRTATARRTARSGFYGLLLRGVKRVNVQRVKRSFGFGQSHPRRDQRHGGMIKRSGIPKPDRDRRAGILLMNRAAWR